MTKQIENWKKEIFDKEARMSNGELLSAVLSLSAGDDYDGCFTVRGEWEYDYLVKMLRKRLSDWLEDKVDKKPSPRCDNCSWRNLANCRTPDGLPCVHYERE